MPVSIELTRVAADTGGGTQDITIPGFGTPAGALFVVGSGVADGVAASHLASSIGVTDGTNQAVVAARSRDGVGTSEADRRGATDEVIMLLEFDGLSPQCEANFDSWITDGVRINWGVAPPSAFIITVVLFAGTDLSINAGQFTSAASDGSSNVDCGFEPDAVLFFGNGTALSDTIQGTSVINLGLATNEIPIVNRAVSYMADDGAATSLCVNWMSEQRCNVNLDTAAIPSVSRSISVSAFITAPVNGFTVQHHSGTSFSALSVAYLALAFNGAVGFKAGTLDTPTSTGDQSQTGIGFVPQFVGLLMGPIESANSGLRNGTIGLSVFTEDDQQSNGWQDEDAVGTTNTQSISDNTAVNLPQDDGSVGHVASLSTMLADGWELTFTSTLVTAKKWPYLAIGGGSLPASATALKSRVNVVQGVSL